MQYDPTRGVYLDDAGHAVPATRIQAALTRIVQDAQAQLAVLGQRRAEGMNTAEWRLEIHGVLKQAHLSAAGLAHGGLDQLTPSLNGVVGARLRTQYTYLSGVALDTSPGDFGGQAMARLAMYADAARGTFYDVTRRSAQDRGLEYEQNVLDDAAEHCEGCLAATDAGVVLIGTLPLPGERDCLSRCLCELEPVAAPEAVGAEA